MLFRLTSVIWEEGEKETKVRDYVEGDTLRPQEVGEDWLVVMTGAELVEWYEIP